MQDFLLFVFQIKRQIHKNECELIADNCLLLNSIDLHYCRGITDVGVSAIAHKRPILDKMNLFSCKGITYKGLSALVQKCPCLCSIGVIRCVTISSGILCSLRRDYPRVRIHH